MQISSANNTFNSIYSEILVNEIIKKNFCLDKTYEDEFNSTIKQIAGQIFILTLVDKKFNSIINNLNSLNYLKKIFNKNIKEKKELEEKTVGKGFLLGLRPAIFQGNPHDVLTLIKAGQEEINALENKPRALPALALAIKLKNIEVVKTLLKDPKINLDIKFHNGRTTIDDIAHAVNNVEILNLLKNHPKRLDKLNDVLI